MNSLVSKVLLTGVLVTSMSTVVTSQKVEVPAKSDSTSQSNVKSIQGGGCSHVMAFQYDKVTYQNTVNDTDFTNIRPWNAETEEPSISLGKVAKSARPFLKSLKLEDEPESLESIVLSKFCGNNWVYVITYIKDGPEKVVKVAPDDLRVLGRRMYLYMRPDGVFITPVEQSRVKVVD